MPNPGRGRKPLNDQGKDLRGLLKSIIRLCLIVIGAPATALTCEGAAYGKSAEALMNLPTTHVGWASPPRHPVNQYGIVPRYLVLAASRMVCGRQYSTRPQQVGGADRPEDQPHPVLISFSAHGWDTTALLQGPKLGHGGRTVPKAR